jgi:Fe-S cluster biogenesis protein NfuA/nitrite reductase/ring-hydroxylating ferredoxin subunit
MSAPTLSEAPEDLLLRVQDLQSRLDAAGDAATREVAEQLVSAIVQMYGVGLERLVAVLIEDGEQGRRLAATLAEDDLIASLLLIHDVHPVPLHERVAAALEQVRPYMESHGGDVELLSLEDGIARIRLRGSCSDCAASAVTLELAIKQALEATAPDLEGLEVEGVAPSPSGPSLPLAADADADADAPANGFELPMVMASAVPEPSPSWFEADHLDLVPVGQMVTADVGGTELLVANVDGALLAYANCCAGCGAPLDGGVLRAGTLACPGCSRSFFLPRAGRSMDQENLQLEPFPLLRERGHVKVALSG